MVPTARNYVEYNMCNVLEMGPDNFGKMLTPENYSLVLIFRLLELMDNFEYEENYLYCHQIQIWFDEHTITFKR